MVLNSVLEALLEGIDECTIRQIGERRKKKNLYCVICPACGSRVVKKELMEKGCYVCGCQETPNKKPNSGSNRVNCS
jgi:ssDNA-binding Zn-finger/Zn-ribbon topoisomerase 1